MLIYVSLLHRLIYLFVLTNFNDSYKDNLLCLDSPIFTLALFYGGSEDINVIYCPVKYCCYIFENIVK